MPVGQLEKQEGFSTRSEGEKRMLKNRYETNSSQSYTYTYYSYVAVLDKKEVQLDETGII